MSEIVKSSKAKIANIRLHLRFTRGNYARRYTSGYGAPKYLNISTMSGKALIKCKRCAASIYITAAFKYIKTEFQTLKIQNQLQNMLPQIRRNQVLLLNKGFFHLRRITFSKRFQAGGPVYLGILMDELTDELCKLAMQRCSYHMLRLNKEMRS